MQALNQIKPNFAYSFLIIAIWTSIVLLYLGPKSNSILDNTFVMFLLTRYFGLWSGAAVLLLRLLCIIKNKYSFIYIFFGSLNGTLGILSFVLFAFKQLDNNFLHMFILNLSIGLIIFTDIFFLNIICKILKIT